VGAMRIASSMEGVHYVLHAPQGDTYADLLFTMIERRNRRPPVTYTTFQARDLGGDTAELVKRTIKAAVDRFQPEALLVGESCTAELIQDQPGSLAHGMDLGGVPVVSLELPAYSKKENWGAAESFYQLVRGLLKDQMPAPGFAKPSPQRWRQEGRRPRVNLLGPSLLGFRCRDDVQEISQLLASHGIDVSVVAPLGARPADLMRLPDADANVCLYAEVAGTVCSWLERGFGMATVKTVPLASAPPEISSRKSASFWGWRLGPRAKTHHVCPGIPVPSIPLTSPASGCSSLPTPPTPWLRPASPARSWVLRWWAWAPTAVSRPARCGPPPSSWGWKP